MNVEDMIKRILINTAILFIFMLPCLIWYRQTGDISIYFTDEVPEGQLLYILSKLMGMYALLCIALQMIVSLIENPRILGVKWQAIPHRVFGGLVIIMAISHLLLFFFAVSLRQGSMAWGLLMPDFHDFYHTHITLGLFGFWILLAILVSGVARILFANSKISLLHNAYWVSIVFVYLHALSIGTDIQSSLGLLLYGALGVVILVLFINRLAKMNRTRMACAE